MQQVLGLSKSLEISHSYALPGEAFGVKTCILGTFHVLIQTQRSGVNNLRIPMRSISSSFPGTFVVDHGKKRIIM